MKQLTPVQIRQRSSTAYRGALRTSFRSFLLLFLFAPIAFAQDASGPQAIQCYTWDQGYVSFFHLMVAFALGGTVIAALVLPPVLSRRYWLFTRPYLRTAAVAGIALVIAIAAVLIWPYLAVDPDYFLCSDVAFGAEGLLGGRVGRNVAAISQRLTMVGFLMLAALVGAVLSLLITAGLNRYVTGIPKQVARS